MKILQIIGKMMRVGGAEKFALDLSLSLSKINDVEVEVLSISTPLNNDFTDILKQNGIRHHTLSNKMYSLSNILKLKKFLDNGNYDVVHVHLIPALYYASIAKKLCKSKFKLLHTEHSTYIRRSEKPFFSIIDRYIYKNYDSIIGISDKVKSNLDKYLKTDRVKVINNGLDISAITNTPSINIHRELNISADATVVTMVSRLAPGKDFATLISAVKQLPQNFHLLFAGDGPLMPELQKQRDESGIASRIHILGVRKDIIGVLKDSDIIVLSTIHEGFSIAMLEAMACHKPFVGSAVEGIADLVDDTTELFEYQNASQLAQILSKLSSDRAHYDKIADNCFEFAKRFDIDRIARQYLDEYLR